MMMKQIKDYYLAMGGSPQYYQIFLSMLNPDRLTSAPGVSQVLTDASGRVIYGLWYELKQEENEL